MTDVKERDAAQDLDMPLDGDKGLAPPELFYLILIGRTSLLLLTRKLSTRWDAACLVFFFSGMQDVTLHFEPLVVLNAPTDAVAFCFSDLAIGTHSWP